MLARLSVLFLGVALALPAAPAFLGCFVQSGTENPPRTCDWWDSANGVPPQLYRAGMGIPVGPTFFAAGVTVFDLGIRPLGYLLDGPMNLIGATPLNPGDTQTAEYVSRLFFGLNDPANLYFLENGMTRSTATLTSVTSSPDGPVRSYSTEIQQLDFVAGGFLFRESPTLASSGQTILAAQPNGLYAVASFFDIFFEVSPDNGQTWIPADAPLRVEATQNMPEANTSLLLILGFAGILAGSNRFRSTRKK